MDKIYNHGPRPQAVLELTQPDNARDIYLYLLLGEIRVGGGGSQAGFKFFWKKKDGCFEISWFSCELFFWARYIFQVPKKRGGLALLRQKQNRGGLVEQVMILFRPSGLLGIFFA